MCGFAGFYTTINVSNETRLNNLKHMSKEIKHRGPDGEGFWVDSDSGIALSHRRLAIVDLSPNGHQPMASPSGRYMMVFNGEIYNYQCLRAEINSISEANKVLWRGSSDTEVMLTAFDVWGIDTTIQKLKGMFAFAVWDLKEQSLYLGRDRMGEKPLYYGWCGTDFLFGSELKALKAHPGFDKVIDMQAVGLFLKYNYIPTPLSIYTGIFKLKPGAILCFEPEHQQQKTLPLPKQYWSLYDIALNGSKNPTNFSEKEAVDHLEYLLNQSVKRQMIADVPVGAFLSGGIDSSMIVSLMQKQSKNPVKTFTIGFEQKDLNEAEYAKDIANYLKTDHTEMYVSDKQAMDVIPLLPELYDEPFADSSQIPTYLISKLARQQVTVSLSGDGGDEVFGGYNRHIMANQLENLTRKIPAWVCALVGNTLGIIPPAFLNKTSELSSIIFSKKIMPSQLGDKIKKFADILCGNKEDIYQILTTNFHDGINIMSASPAENLLAHEAFPKKNIPNLACRMMLSDSLSYLPDDILVKVDRASMGVSLETRVPMLDKDVMEFAWQLPISMKIKNGKGKHILRQVLSRYIPTNMIERPKQGFAVPLDSWLRGPLIEWAESLLNEKAINETAIFDSQTVQKIWKEHLSGRKNRQQQLWGLLMFQSWFLSQK